MSVKKIAVACQGGGINAAFTYGVLRKLLHKQGQQAGDNADDSFEIVALSGTSAGALCAFMTWYGLVPKEGSPGSAKEAIEALDKLWSTFSAQTVGEKIFNKMAVEALRLQEKGMPEVKTSPYSFFHDLMMKQLSLMGLRQEFVDFTALLDTCAPKFHTIQQKNVDPRLFIGAVEILSGKFQAFDSKEPQSESKRNITLGAIRASGTLPDVRKAERIENAECVEGKVRDCYYWDGLFSQNPPVREFLTKPNNVTDKPDEIWIIRINPQEREELPTIVEDIEDRRNELAGNLSLNQELEFIEIVNKWIEKIPDFGNKYRKVTVRTIKMRKSKSDALDVPSKFDRDPEFIEELKQEGETAAELFLEKWPDQAGKWPEDTVYEG